MNQEQRTPPRNVSVRHAAVVTACLGVIALLLTLYWLAAIRLPDPASADRNGLIRWMVLSDLDTQPEKIRSALLTRLQDEIAGNLDPSVLESQLDDRFRTRLWKNIQVLIETWLSTQLDKYLATPSDNRPEFLDQTIAEAEKWQDLIKLRAMEASDSSAPGTAMLILFGEVVNRWKGRVSPKRQEEIEEFDTALRWRWFLRALGLTSGKSD